MAPPPPAWVVCETCLRYQAIVSKPRRLNERTKPPSSATVDDIPARVHDAVQILRTMLVTDLSRPNFAEINI